MANVGERPFDVIAFDLDDTLLDTSLLLIPNAAREACQAMITAGLNARLEECLIKRDELARHGRRKNLYRELVTHFGTTGGAAPEQVARAGDQAFHNRSVEPTITPITGTTELLAKLRESYQLYLVTSGHPITQSEKIRILNIAGYFKKVLIVDATRDERKRDAFERIQAESGATAARHLSVGNRVDTDIAEARELGWKGCWVRYGEHAAMLPATKLEEPDFQIRQIMELKAACHL